ncbi:peptide deformylase [Ferruginivarius sediminum]|uniref:Peptide deformylase n=1 Tax=Ferruginivarius sediminum TaxID=2661937 RepID=A0A369T9P9_9PROT|nr:peptide deformylase [Ferruginivarius sediminum]RDD61105.1 peptide deformylase [Ferruginivarius sediminum]
MAKLPILIAPNPTLKKVAKPVEKVDDDIRALMDDMLETMYDAPGIGLAAPQVGDLRRILVIDCAREGEEPQPIRMANPEILERSEQMVTGEEGCLSLPDIFADVTRPDAVRVRYLDHENEIREMEAEGMLATVIQHEVDHLNGILFVDHLSSLKRNMLMRKLAKMRQKKGGKVSQKEAAV